MQDSLHLDWASLPVPLAFPWLFWVSLHDSSPPHILPSSLLPASLCPSLRRSLPSSLFSFLHPTVLPLGSLQEGTQRFPLMGHIYEGRGGPARLSAQRGARPLPLSPQQAAYPHRAPLVSHPSFPLQVLGVQSCCLSCPPYLPSHHGDSSSPSFFQIHQARKQGLSSAFPCPQPPGASQALTGIPGHQGGERQSQVPPAEDHFSEGCCQVPHLAGSLCTGEGTAEDPDLAGGKGVWWEVEHGKAGEMPLCFPPDEPPMCAHPPPHTDTSFPFFLGSLLT